MLNAHEVLNGYANGVFPMAEPSEDNVIYWYEPELRGIILPSEFNCPKNLRKEYNRGKFQYFINKDFEATMRSCANREETWISEEIIEVYSGLKSMGYGFSFEVWQGDVMVGGLYGIALGKVFLEKVCFIA